MIPADMYFFGYHEYTVDPCDLKCALELLLRNNIPAIQYRSGFIASALKKKEIESLLATRVKFSRSKVKGLGGLIVNSLGKIGLISALMAITLLFLLSGDIIWDIRVDGNDRITDEEIISELSSSGLEVGKRWSYTDLGMIETDLLLDSDNLSWVNINRRGTVAYVKVIEKTVFQTEIKEGYSNIVASCDAVIEEISVINGVPKVKVGDSVKAGDLLISGVLPAELGGDFCYAEGIVLGRVSDSVSVFVPEVDEKKLIKDRILSEIQLKIFNFQINIFKSYRNFELSYDIIENEKDFSFLGKRLPFSLNKRYCELYETAEEKLSRDELIKRATEKMRLELLKRTSESTLTRASSSGNFINGGYEIKTDIVCIENITKDVPFEYSANGEK